MIPSLNLGFAELPTWILVLSLTLSVALFWVNHRAQQWQVSGSQALDLSMYMMIGAVAGGRLLHVIYEAPSYYVSNPFAIFRLWQGGFVFYGGLLGALLVARKWCVNHDQSYLRWADFFAPVFAFCYVLGRLGCFLNSCCYGAVCDLPWAVTFPHHAAYGIEVVARHPTQIYAALWEAAVLAGLIYIESRKPSKEGTVFLTWLGLHAVGRLIMEHWRADDRGQFIFGYSLGQWISVFILITTILRGRKRLNRSAVSK